MSRKTTLVVRTVMVALAAFNLYVGVWAVVAPRHWYDNFPGADPRLIAAEPPYNAHLATDAGAGFMAIGVVVLLAAIWLTPLVARIALAGYLAHAIPHFIYHFRHSAPGLTSAENAQNVATLGFLVLVPLGLLLLVFGWIPGRDRDRVPPGPTTSDSS